MPTHPPVAQAGEADGRAKMTKRIVALAGLLAMLAVVPVVLASAAAHHPTGDYAPFADCPLSNPATDVCIFGQTEGGALMIGAKAIPISKRITLQGGIHEDRASGKQEFIGA